MQKGLRSGATEICYKCNSRTRPVLPKSKGTAEQSNTTQSKRQLEKISSDGGRGRFSKQSIGEKRSKESIETERLSPFQQSSCRNPPLPRVEVRTCQRSSARTVCPRLLFRYHCPTAS